MKALLGLGVGAVLLMGCQGANAGGTWSGPTLNESGVPDNEAAGVRMVLREEVAGVVEGELFFDGDAEVIPAGALRGTRVGEAVELEGVGLKLTGGKLTAKKLTGVLVYEGTPTDPEPIKTRVELSR